MAGVSWPRLRGAGVVQRATTSWAGTGTGPINSSSSASGSFTRYLIEGLMAGLPLGTKDTEEAKKYTDESPHQRAVVLVPTGMTPPTKIDVFLFLHGYNIGWREGKKTNQNGYAFMGAVRDREADKLADGLPTTMVAVLPQGTAKSGFGTSMPSAIITEALAAVPGWSKVKPHRIVLSGHSGAGDPLSQLLESKSTAGLAVRQAERKSRLPGLSEVALFDAINVEKGKDDGPQLRRVWEWVQDQINDDIAALSVLSPTDQAVYLQNSMRFRAFYSNGEFYGPVHLNLKARIGKILPKKVPPAHKVTISQGIWDLLYPNYEVLHVGQTHSEKLKGNLKTALDALPAGGTPTYPYPQSTPAPAPPPPLPAPSPSSAAPLLKFGMTGPEVESVQRQLNVEGLQSVASTAETVTLAPARGLSGTRRHPATPNSTSPLALTVDGIFGPRTHAAVVAFQRKKGLVPDGKVGPLTRHALEARSPQAEPSRASLAMSQSHSFSTLARRRKPEPYGCRGEIGLLSQSMLIPSSASYALKT